VRLPAGGDAATRHARSPAAPRLALRERDRGAGGGAARDAGEAAARGLARARVRGVGGAHVPAHRAPGAAREPHRGAHARGRDRQAAGPAAGDSRHRRPEPGVVAAVGEALRHDRRGAGHGRGLGHRLSAPPALPVPERRASLRRVRARGGAAGLPAAAAAGGLGVGRACGRAHHLAPGYTGHVRHGRSSLLDGVPDADGEPHRARGLDRDRARADDASRRGRGEELSPLLPAAGGRVLRIGVDARSLQPGFREDSARGIGVYARELLRVLAARQDVALTLWFEPALPVLNGLVPAGVLTRRYAPTPLPLRDRLASQLSVLFAARGRHHDVFHWLSHMHAPAFPPRRSVLTVHDLILERFAHIYPRHTTVGYRAARELEGMAMRKATVLIADSNATRDDLLASHATDPNRVRVAPLGV